MNKELFINELYKMIPLELDEAWDNSGIQVENSKDKTDKVLVSLDVDENIVKEADSIGADTIITHHPLFFNGIKKIGNNDRISRVIRELVKSDIQLISFHTCFDKMEGGNNTYLGKLIFGGGIISTLDDQGLLKGVYLKDAMRISEIADIISEKIPMPKERMLLVGSKDEYVRKIAWCSGAGMDLYKLALDKGAELFITGDVKYHQAFDALSNNTAILDIGHYGSEIIFAENLVDILKGNEAFKELDVVKSKLDTDPFNML